jgi:hypothetical protein
MIASTRSEDHNLTHPYHHAVSALLSAVCRTLKIHDWFDEGKAHI